MRGLTTDQPSGLARVLAAADTVRAHTDRAALGLHVARARRADILDLLGHNGHVDTYAAWTVGALDRVIAALDGTITDPDLLRFVGILPKPQPTTPDRVALAAVEHQLAIR